LERGGANSSDTEALQVVIEDNQALVAAQLTLQLQQILAAA